MDKHRIGPSSSYSKRPPSERRILSSGAGSLALSNHLMAVLSCPFHGKQHVPAAHKGKR